MCNSVLTSVPFYAFHYRLDLSECEEQFSYSTTKTLCFKEEIKELLGQR